MKKFLSVAFGCLFLLAAHVSDAAEYSLKGKQIRGTPGKNAKLESSPVSIPKSVTIVRCQIHPADAGFWFQEQQGSIVRFDSCDKARNAKIPKGVWTVYPNLKTGVNEAGISIVLKD